jgi:hypothetical protein
VPLSGLQRQWYRRFLENSQEARQLLSRQQLIAKMMQVVGCAPPAMARFQNATPSPFIQR